MNYGLNTTDLLAQSLRLAREIRARQCRDSLLEWCKEVLEPLDQTPAVHHRLLIKELADVAAGKTRRLMINMPPGSAKSTFGSVLFPPWVLGQKKNFKLIGASNTAPLAEMFSRRVMGVIRDHETELDYSLTRESAELWETTNGASYRAVGVGGTIAGHRADGVIIDDPTRSRADAESETVRESQWNWFTSDLRTRLKPSAWIVLIMTRWHPDDLGGRLLDRQPGLWRVINLPAIAGEDDALGREPGDWLWSDDDYGYAGALKEVYEEYEKAGAMRDWAALYQQQPVTATGSIFKTDKIIVLDPENTPKGGVFARGWDLAATEQIGTRNPDWTAGVKIQRAPDGRFIIHDVRRVRKGPEDTEATIVNTADVDGHGCKVSIPQDPGQAGKQQVLYLTKKLAGYLVDSSPETGDKATRASPVASQCNVGNLYLVRGEWNHAFIDELAGFPGGMKDDQVDALSRAFSMVSISRPMAITPSGKAPPRPMRMAR